MEHLSVGDLVATSDGAARSVRWIGRRAFGGRFIAGNREVLPVVVRAGSVADGMPERDLVLSPKHALLFDGVPIPVEALLDGAGIRQLTGVDTVEYFHVELDVQAAVLAEGMPAESFDPSAGRAMFHNADEYDRLYRHEPVRAPAAQHVSSGPAVEAVRSRIAERATARPMVPVAGAGERIHVLPQRQVQRRVVRKQPGRRRQALIIAEHLPGPDTAPGLMSHALALRRLGYQVSIAPADGWVELPVDAAGNSALAEAGIECFGAPRFRTVEEVLRTRAGQFSLVYLHQAGVARAYESLVRVHCPAAWVVLGAPELTHVRLQAQAAVQGSDELLAEADRMRQQVLLAAYSCDATVVHSHSEQRRLTEALPGAAVHVVPWSMAASSRPPPRCSLMGVGLVGDFAREADVDAAVWLARTVMPMVWREHPALRLFLGGTAPPEIVRDLAGPLVTLLPDAGAVLNQVRVTTAPLRFSAGVHGPVLDSLAAGVPCAMTGEAADGLALAGPLATLVAADGAGVAATILALHREQAAHAACAAAGLELVRRDWSDAAVDAALRGVLAVPAVRHQSK